MIKNIGICQEGIVHAAEVAVGEERKRRYFHRLQERCR